MAPNIDRPLVVWLGAGPPQRLRDLLLERDLQVLNGDLATIVQHHPRAVILPFVGTEPGIFSRLWLPVLGSGALLIVLTDTHRDYAWRILDNFSVISDEDRHGTDEAAWYVFGTPDFVRIAQECALHRPGPVPNDTLVIDAHEERALPKSPEDDLLLRRAFSDFDRIRLTSLDGGKSGAGLTRVDAFRADGSRSQPFVAKLGVAKRIADEIDATRKLVVDYVPFRHRPPIAVERCVRGPSKRMMTSMFVEAERLDEFLRHENADGIVRSLLSGPLRTWRSEPISLELALGNAYTKYRLLPSNLSRLGGIAPAGFPGPEELIAEIQDLPVRKVRVCPSHGDLHVWNIFITDTREVVLIDFAAADREPTHAARDFATLDVSLMFYIEPLKERPFAEDVLRRQYEDTARALPAPEGDLVHHHRIEMLRDLRYEAQRCCLSPDEYRIAVACALLRYAAVEKDESLKFQRPLAYELAARLVPR